MFLAECRYANKETLLHQLALSLNILPPVRYILGRIQIRKKRDVIASARCIYKTWYKSASLFWPNTDDSLNERMRQPNLVWLNTLSVSQLAKLDQIGDVVSMPACQLFFSFRFFFADKILGVSPVRKSLCPRILEPRIGCWGGSTTPEMKRIGCWGRGENDTWNS